MPNPRSARQAFNTISFRLAPICDGAPEADGPGSAVWRWEGIDSQAQSRRGQVVTQRMKSPMIQPDASGRHVLTVMRYGDLNPVRAGMVRSPKDYAWSSYRHYAFGEPNELIDDEPEYLALGQTRAQRCEAYRQLFALSLSDALRIRRPDLVEVGFYGDAAWMERRAPRAAGPPS